MEQPMIISVYCGVMKNELHVLCLRWKQICLRMQRKGGRRMKCNVHNYCGECFDCKAAGIEIEEEEE